jgi:hypothetical protein
VSALSAALYGGEWKHRIFRTLSRVKLCVVFSSFSMSSETEFILHVKYVMRVLPAVGCTIAHTLLFWLLTVKDPFVVNKLALGKVFVQ